MLTEKQFFRLFCAGGVLACTGGMGFALYLQYVQHLEPCPMCVFQRVAMIGCGLFFFLGMLHAPDGMRGRVIYSVLAGLSATAGGLIAARHVWLQSLPPDQVPACGPALDYLMDVMPIMEVVQTVLRGDGNCAVIDWTLLGLSLPAWTGIGFLLLIDWAFLSAWLPRRLAANHSQ